MTNKKTTTTAFIMLLLAVTTTTTMMMLAWIASAMAQEQQQQEEPSPSLLGDKVIPSSDTITTFVDDTGFTINEVPPGWTVIDHDNTSPGTAERQRESNIVTIATLCPPYSKAESRPQLVEGVGEEGEYICADPRRGEIPIVSFPSMDQRPMVLAEATEEDPQTGLLVLNLTAESVLEHAFNPISDEMVQNKTVPIDITYAENGTTSQIPGIMALFMNPDDFNLSYVGLYFIDHENNATGYEIKVDGPRGPPTAGGLVLPDTPILPNTSPSTPDPRGEPIQIHGIGLDNLPPILDEPMQIMNSVSITSR
jgi:hypothetical protein